MGIKFTNNASTTLASGITAAATSLTVATGTGVEFPTLGAGDYCYATIISASDPNVFEIIKVTARTSDTLTIVRAQEGTTAAIWSSGAKVELRLTAQGLTEFDDRIVALEASQDWGLITGSPTSYDDFGGLV